MWEGLTAPELRERFAEEWRVWLDYPRRAVLPGGERLAEVEERALAGLALVREKHRAGETILVVAHEAVNRVLLCSFLGWGTERFRFLNQGNTAVNLVKFYSSHTQVCLLNDTCHLKKPRQIN